MRKPRRSECPVNLTVEMLGDRWSLIVIRDIMFGSRRHYSDLLQLSTERIASNILANRLRRLVHAGLLTRRSDPAHKQKAIYSLTEASIQLVPLFAQICVWGLRHTQPSEEMAVRARLMEEGGEKLWAAFMAELRAIHLAAPAPRRSVLAELEAVFQAAIRKQKQTRRIRALLRTASLR